MMKGLTKETVSLAAVAMSGLVARFWRMVGASGGCPAAVVLRLRMQEPVSRQTTRRNCRARHSLTGPRGRPTRSVRQDSRREANRLRHCGRRSRRGARSRRGWCPVGGICGNTLPMIFVSLPGKSVNEPHHPPAHECQQARASQRTACKVAAMIATAEMVAAAAPTGGAMRRRSECIARRAAEEPATAAVANGVRQAAASQAAAWALAAVTV